MPLIKPDGLHQLQREDYDSLQDRINLSTLRLMARSPAHYRHALLEPRADTDAMKLGRATHLAVLEPERFRGSVAVWDGGRRAGKDYEAFVAKNQDRELLTEAEFAECTALQAAVRSHPIASQYLGGGKGEVTILWTAESGDRGVNSYRIPCRGRIDFDSGSVIVDLKTTRDASEEAFKRQAWNLKYFVQAAWYCDAYEKATGVRKGYALIAIEKDGPREVVVYRPTERSLALGRAEYRLWLDRLAWCREHSVYPGYADGEVELDPPRWALPDDDAGSLGLEIGSDNGG
jgi:hypothetical protein